MVLVVVSPLLVNVVSCASLGHYHYRVDIQFMDQYRFDTQLNLTVHDTFLKTYAFRLLLHEYMCQYRVDTKLDFAVHEDPFLLVDVRWTINVSIHSYTSCVQYCLCFP